ncbi:MAG: sulfatase-like hydrolase/transferase [Acidobacteriota bacterium]
MIGAPRMGLGGTVVLMVEGARAGSMFGNGNGKVGTGGWRLLAAAMAVGTASLAVGCGGGTELPPEAAVAGSVPEVATDRRSDLQAGPNLLLVTLDTTRADHLHVYGYPQIETPRIDRLAAGGVRFDQVASAVPITLPSHSTIMTGQYPLVHGVRHNGTYRLENASVTLAEVLRAVGYATGGFVSSFVVDSRFGIAQGFDTYTDFRDLEASAGQKPLLDLQRRGDKTVAAALEWLRRQQTPFFAWVHLYDPHSPYDPPEPYASRYRERPYDGEIAFTDEMVGRLLDGLEQVGHGGDTLVVVAADHGEGLGEHGEEWHTFFIYDTTMRVPLILWAPAALPAGRVISGQASLVDILPTCLALLDVTDPAAGERQGRDLRPWIETPTAAGTPAYSETLVPLLTFGWSELRSLRVGGWKYIAAPHPELYDLRADPGESRNLVAAEPSRAAILQRQLEELVGDDDPVAFAARQRVADAETIERLRALGYLGGGDRVASNREIDPKDKIGVFEAFNDGFEAAVEAVSDERWDAASEQLQVLDRMAPHHFIVQYYLGRVALARKQVQVAISRLEESLELNPSYSLTYVELAKAYRFSGQPQRGVELLQEAMHAYPDVFSFPFNLGYLYHMERRFDEALKAYREAREMLPRHPQLLSNMANLYLLRRQPQAAQAALEVVVEVKPEDASAWGNLGTVYGGLGRMDEAEAAFRRALQLQPRQARLHYNLGLVLLRQGRSEEAAAAFRRALEIDPDLEEARRQLRRISG